MSNEADRTFGIKTKDRKLIIGDTNITIDGSDIEVLDSDGKVKELEALECLYRSTGLIFLQWQKEVFNNYHSIPAF